MREGEWKRDKGQIGGKKLTGSHKQGVITPLNDILGKEYMSVCIDPTVGPYSTVKTKEVF